MGGKGAPSAPKVQSAGSFVSPGPATTASPTSATQQSPGAYVNPGPYQAAPNPESVVPNVFTWQQLGQKSDQLDQYLPAWMRLAGSSNPIDPNSAGFQDARNAYYAQNVAPQIASDQAAQNTSGGDYGSYAGGLQSTDVAQGNLAAYNAGLNYSQSLFQDVLNGRQNFFGTNVAAVAGQNALDVNRGLGVSQIQTQQQQNLNQYNLQNSQNQNQFDLGSASLNNNFQLGNQSNENQFSLGNQSNTNQFNLGASGQQNQFDLGNASQQNQANSNNFSTEAGLYNNSIANFGLFGTLR